MYLLLLAVVAQEMAVVALEVFWSNRQSLCPDQYQSLWAKAEPVHVSIMCVK
jgi:hypothetical protein